MQKQNRTASLVLSVDPESKERLRAYASQNHKSMSQAVIDWIWTLPVKEDNNGKENGNGDA